MSPVTQTTVTSAANALDSLERFATELERKRPETPLALKGMLTWGWHAVALLAYLRLQAQAREFDEWLWPYLDEGEPGLDVDRDSHWEERQRLSLLELVDILSEEDLPSLKPEFYQGWTDRTERCRTLRRQAAAIIGSSITAGQRDALLVLIAAYHRLIRFPVPVDLEVGPVLEALPKLVGLLEMFEPAPGPDRDAFRTTLERCRSALP